eukprot:3035774-Rhodomonas_salina.3
MLSHREHVFLRRAHGSPPPDAHRPARLPVAHQHDCGDQLVPRDDRDRQHAHVTAPRLSD